MHRDSAEPVNVGFRAIPLKKFSKCRGTDATELAFFLFLDDICEMGGLAGRGWTLVHPDYTVRFWGVRGSIACPGPDTIRYGGNTSCVEIRCGGRLMIFDGGTGLRLLGNELMATGHPAELDLFYSHTHFDHICGLPFFAPCYDERSSLHIWAGHLNNSKNIEAVINKMMIAPLFPIPMGIFAAKIAFTDFAAGDVLTPHPGIVLRTGPLNHPNGATGYRIEYGDKTVAYITDTEHRPGVRDPNVLALIRSADVMIYDGSYTDDEYPSHQNWGHSTWQEGVRLADAAGVKTLIIFHHDPGHDDAFMDQIAADAAAARPGTIVAQEGLVVRP
jgi:phosphoribosyl 1,2-cyclic phosphodiesterase